MTDWLAQFEKTGALLTGHFRLSSGLHSDRYLQCALLLQWPELAGKAGRELAGSLAGFDAQTVASPALGGVVIGHEVARALAIRAIFAERKDGVMALRRGFRLEPGERVVVVEDVFTTGKSTRETIAVLERAGAQVMAAGSIVNRGLADSALPVPSSSLLRLEVPAWPEDACPLCRSGVPVESPGSRFG
jgi:orotate phosphoribosyltransferase